jgi:endonuclease YncB( thermonuclease family)
MIRAHRTQGVALGYHLAPRWGKRPLDRIPSIIVVFGISVGDTITVLVNRKPLKILLDGIDAPESRPSFGKVPKQALSCS